MERIHLQYEDGVSNPKQPYTLGLRLASLRYQGRTNADILEAMRDMAEVGSAPALEGRRHPLNHSHWGSNPSPNRRTFRGWTQARSCTRSSSSPTSASI